LFEIYEVIDWDKLDEEAKLNVKKTILLIKSDLDKIEEIYIEEFSNAKKNPSSTDFDELANRYIADEKYTVSMSFNYLKSILA